MSIEEVKTRLTELTQSVVKLDQSLSPHIEELIRKEMAEKAFVLYQSLSTVAEVYDKCEEMINCIQGFYHEQAIIQQGI